MLLKHHPQVPVPKSQTEPARCSLHSAEALQAVQKPAAPQIGNASEQDAELLQAPHAPVSVSQVSIFDEIAQHCELAEQPTQVTPSVEQIGVDPVQLLHALLVYARTPTNRSTDKKRVDFIVL